MENIFILGLFLLYLWYFHLHSSSTPPVPPPLAGSPAAAAVPFAWQFSVDPSNRFRFELNGNVVWSHAVPESHLFEKGKIVEETACHRVPDGEGVLAEGRRLYDYLMENPFQTSHDFRQNAPFVLQHGHVFYFQCAQGRIESIHMCPSGETFSRGRCRPVSPCTHQPNGTLLNDPGGPFSYLICRDGEARRAFCPPDSFFLVNDCYPQTDLIDYCNRYKTSMLLNDTTRVDCVGKEPQFTTCPPGFRFFELQGECEPADCSNRPDGTRLALSRQIEGPFGFAPGYNVCTGGRRGPPVYCPHTWDPLLSKGDDLTHLPMVFDGETCAVPAFCENVIALEDDLLVPAHEFTKDVANWQLAPLYDSLTGYACVNGARQRVRLNPGERIVAFDNSQPNRRIPKFEREKCGLGDDIRLPIYGQWHRYFDCATQTELECEANEQFNGETCVERNPHAFRYKGLELFTMSELREFDGWMEPVTYLPKHVPKPACLGEESEYIETYNVCSHPHCVKYPFLMQSPSLSIVLPDKEFRCAFDDREKSIRRTSVTDPYDFWSQRMVVKKRPLEEEACQFGKRLKTGNYMWDQTVFATCDLEQPFVFCPSSETRGIVHVEGKRFACEVPSHLHSTEYATRECTTFYPRELDKIRPIDVAFSTTYRFAVDSYILPADGVEPPDSTIEFCTSRPVILDFKYRITYPLDVVYERGVPRVSNFIEKSAFLTHKEDFTKRPVTVRRHLPEPFVAKWRL